MTTLINSEDKVLTYTNAAVQMSCERGFVRKKNNKKNAAGAFAEGPEGFFGLRDAWSDDSNSNRNSNSTTTTNNNNNDDNDNDNNDDNNTIIIMIIIIITNNDNSNDDNSNSSSAGAPLHAAGLAWALRRLERVRARWV